MGITASPTVGVSDVLGIREGACGSASGEVEEGMRQ